MAERIDWSKVSRSTSLIRRSGDSAGRAETFEHVMHSILEEYGYEVDAILEQVGRETTRRLVDRTIATAPIGSRLTKSGHPKKRPFDIGRPHLRDSISMMRLRNVRNRPAFLWYVRSPNSRIAHLVEHGYWNDYRGWGYSGSHFVKNAVKLETVRYHNDLEQALADAGYEIEMKYARSVDLRRKHRIVKIG